MSESISTVIPKWFKVIAVLAVLWNLFGCFMWSMEMFAQEALMEKMTGEQKEWVGSIPDWIYVIYAVAVTTGLLGSIGLLMQKNWAVPMFGISLVLVVVQMLYPTLIGGGLQVMGPSSLAMPAIVISIATTLLWLALTAKNKSWLHA